LPTDRYSSARAMADDLRLYLDGRTVEPARPAAPWRRAGRAITARPLRAVLLTYAIVSGIALPVVAVSCARAERRLREKESVGWPPPTRPATDHGRR
jgi:hypothetical protein